MAFSLNSSNTLILIGLLFSAGPVSGNPFFQLNLGGGSESNVPRGLDSLHQESSAFLTARFSGGKLWQLGLNDTLTLSGDAVLNRFTDLNGFNHLELGTAATWRHKFGFGAYAPRLNTTLAVAGQEYDGRARDRVLSTATVSLEKRWSPAWMGRIGVEFESSGSKSLPDDPDVTNLGYDPDIRLSYELFDYEALSAFGSVDYTFSNGVMVMGGYRRTDGVVVASTSQPSLAVYKLSNAFYSDPAFDTAWFGYQLAADINAWHGAISFPVGRDSAVDFGLQRFDIQAAGERDYDNSRVTLSFTRNF